ncbi:hypothetical protein [uncultured Sulfuricurvum sp.]|uniref:hypothetical protein n=1 Tax=uncultured Sulfuricurvum sp. TaxID=430693 RepID=UPI00262A6E9F|nr:hypothetical protein [uncultured Sulfuricurvum sp.]
MIIIAKEFKSKSDIISYLNRTQTSAAILYENIDPRILDEVRRAAIKKGAPLTALLLYTGQ